MKLHLPNGLRKAVLACMAVVTSLATTVGTGIVAGGTAAVVFYSGTAYAEDAITYSDTIYTWNGATSGLDLAHGIYHVTEVADNGKFTVSDDDVLKGWSAAAGTGTQAGMTVWGTLAPNKNNVINGYHTLRFASSGYGQDAKNATFTFNKLSLGGIIVDNGATGYSVKFTNSANSDRTINLGRPDDTASYSSINEDFTLDNSGSTHQNNYFTLRGTQTIDIARGKTFSIKSSVHGINITGNVTIDGGGTFDMQSASTITGTLTIADGNLNIGDTILNNGTLTVTGKVDLGVGMAAGGSATENGFVGVVYQVLDAASTGTANFDGVTEWTSGGAALAGSYADGAFTSGEKIYAIVESGSHIVASTISDEVGYVISGADSTLVLDDISSLSALAKGVEVNVTGAATVELGKGLTADATEILRTAGTLNVTVADGAVLNLSVSTGAPNINGSITINGGGVVNATVNDAVGWSTNQTQNINMQGEAGKLATMNVGGRLTQSTNINLSGYAQILDKSPADSTDPAAFDTFGGTITATGTNNTIGIRLRDRNALTIDVTNEGDELLVTGQVMASKSGGNGVFTKTGAGTLTFDNAASVLPGKLDLQAGKVVFADNFELRGGLTMAATAAAVVDAGATLTINGGTITLGAAQNYGDGTLAFAGDVTLDVSAFTEFDPTVAGSSLTLGQVGALDISAATSLSLTTAMANELMPVISLDDSGNIVLSITGRQLSWIVPEDASSASLTTNNISVVVNYKDGAYEAVYAGGTAVSEAVADGTGSVQVVKDKEMLNDSVTVTLESGTYSGVKFMQVGGDLKGTLGSETDQKKLTLNITGDASVSNFIGGGQGILGWCNGGADVSLYTDIEFNINTTGTVAGVVMTAEDNAGKFIKVYGDLTANIESGTITALMNNGSAYDTNTGAALAAGSKGMYIEGDITYNLGKAGNDDAALVFEGNVVGTVSQQNSGATGSTKGEVLINLNSGTYQSVYGTGNKAEHDGNVTINYNGGVINGLIKGTAGANVTGDKTLNIGGALAGDKVAMDTFDAVNVLGGASLSYAGGNTLTLLPCDLNVADGGSVIFADDFVLGKVLSDINMETAGALDVTGVTSFTADLADYECKTTVNEDGTMNYSWELMDSSIFTGVDTLLGLDSALSVSEDGKLLYALNNVATIWDPNWGGAALSNQPATDAIQEFSTTETIIGNAIQKDGLVAIRLVSNDAIGLLNMGSCDAPTGVFGGAYDPGNAAGTAVSADVWIEAQGGCYGTITGGNMAGNWNGSSASSFAGDTHILLNDNPDDEKRLYVGLVVGGNFADGEDTGDKGARFTGDTYVSVYTNSMAGSVIGGSVNYHGATSYFTGDTHVFVYVPLTDDGVEYRNEGLAVVGGSAINNGTHNFTGSTNLTVDVTDYAGLKDGNGVVYYNDFAKRVIGGFYCLDFQSNGIIKQADGEVNLSVVGTTADGQMIYFNEGVYGAGYMKAAANITTGNVNMSLTGGKYTKLVMGGVYAFTGNSTTVSGDINLTVKDVVLDNGLYGGHHVHGTGTATITLETGDINLTVDGKSITADVIGGSYIERGKADTGQSLKQGNIVVNLKSGAIGGDVYAEGETGTPNDGKSAAAMTTASTTVAISSTVALSEGKTVSGGHKGAAGAEWTVTGARTLSFTDAATYDNLGSVNFVDFDTVAVAEGGSASVKELGVHGTALTKNGAGAFAVTDKALAVDTITMNGGSLTAAYGVSSGLTANITAPSKLTLGKELTLAALNIDMTGAVASESYIDVTAALKSDGKIAVNLTGIEGLAAGEYILVSSTSTSLTTADLNTTLDAEAPAGMEYVVEVVGNNIVFRSAFLSDWVWEGSTNGEGTVWADSEDGWKSDSGSPNGQDVYFTAAAEGSVTISGTVTPANIDISGGEYTYEADAATGGSIKLATQDSVLHIGASATVNMALDNAELGGTTDLEGTLVLQSADAIGNTALKFNGGTLVYDTLVAEDDTKTHIATDLSKQASLAEGYDGLVKIEVTDADNTVTWTRAAWNEENSGVAAILDKGIEKTGAGTMNVNYKFGSSVTYAGTFDVQEGTLNMNGSFAGNPVPQLTFSGGMNVADGAALNFTFDHKVYNRYMTFTGSMSGAGTITMGGDCGRLQISGNNSGFAGTLVLQGSGVADSWNRAGFANADAFGGADTKVQINGRGFYFGTTDTTLTSAIEVLGDSAGNVLDGSTNHKVTFTGAWTVAEDAAFGSLEGGPNISYTVTLAGDLTGYKGTLRTLSNNTWVLGGEGVAGAGSVDMKEVNGTGKLKVQYSTETVLNTAVAGSVNLQQSGDGKLILAAENTTSGKLTVDAGKEVQLGNAAVAGTWVGSELAGEGSLILTHGALQGLTTKAEGATLAVKTTKGEVSTFDIGAGGGTVVDLRGSDATLLDSIELVEGSTLLVDDALTVGGEGNTTLDMAFTTDNMTSDGTGTAMIQGGALTIAGTEGVNLNLNNADVLTAINNVGDGDLYLQITDGELSTAEGLDINAVINPNLLSLGVRAQLTDEAKAGGYVLINGDVSGVYFTDNQEGCSADTQDSVAVNDATLEIYAATVVNSGDTLTVGTDTTINNLNGQEGGNVVITDGATVTLNNESLATGVDGYDPMGADNELAGSLTGESGTTINVQGEGGSLTVGDAISADTLNVNEGTLVANSGATVNTLTVGADAALNLGAAQSMELGDATVDGSLSGAEGSSLSATGLLTVGDTGNLQGVALEIADGGELFLNGSGAVADVTSLQGGSGATITGEGGSLYVGDAAENSFGGTLAGHGSLTTAAGSSLVLDNATGSDAWDVTNNGSMLVDVTESGNITLGALELAAGSDTTLRINSDNGTDGLLTLQTLVVDDAANVTLLSTGAGQLAAGEYTLGTVTDGYEGAEELHVDFSGTAFSQLDKLASYIYVDDNGNIILNAVKTETNGLTEVASEPNAQAGAALLWDAEAPVGGELESVYNAVNDMIAAGNVADANETMAAVAGSSTAALGMAFAGDVDRQLRAIRNRTTTMGVNQCVINEDMPYYNAWVNAEGNLGELDKDGTFAGYQLDSWGGTIGFDVDVNPYLTVGLAVTAMYGDITVDGPDMLEGDLDTYYVSAFARYSKRAWTHTFVATVGMMDSSYERTVSHAGGSYTAEGDTDGMAFGIMYEVGRVIAISEDSDACWQPIFNVAYRHTTVGGYTETATDAALDVDDQTLDTVTIGAGARLQAVVGENLYNRTSVLEMRALAKFDIGDRASEADVALINGSGRGTVESAELGAFGVELGAGLSVPLGAESGTLFFDASAELRSGYTNLNGTVGWRINF